MTQIKGKEGMGFRDIQNFNTALLVKQLWKILTKPNLLVNRVMRGKYFKGKAIFETKPCPGNSWIWQSLLSAKDLLEEGLRKRIGDGCTVDIWEDRWLWNKKSGKVQARKPPHCQVQKVKAVDFEQRVEFKGIE